MNIFYDFIKQNYNFEVNNIKGSNKLFENKEKESKNWKVS